MKQKRDDAAAADTANGTLLHCWWQEPATAEQNTQSLTEAGVENIANHKYKSGHYTYLDNAFNPLWQTLTDLLPLWLAPNMVTTLGFSHLLLSYLATWYYSSNFDNPATPNWVIFLSGYCSIVYYTLDCMDGKQARRTGQSSPLGQLFDHGFDCVGNLCHISTQAGYLCVGGTSWFYAFQGSLFLAFFMAQWEEYYTGELTHAIGNFGVTEMNYGIGLFAILNALLGVQGRINFWSSMIADYYYYVPSPIQQTIDSLYVVPDWFLELEIKHFGLSIWLLMSVVLIGCSIHRVVTHDLVTKNKLALSAVSKLLTPLVVSLSPFLLCSTETAILEQETRYLSLCQGLLLSYLTIKMISFSMAKQSYASIQIDAIIPYLLVLVWLKYGTNLTSRGVHVILGLTCWYYLYKLLSWSHSAIYQITKRLDIYCFTIKHPQGTQQYKKWM